MADEQPGTAIDRLDALLIALLHEEPRIGVLECSRRLRVARGTVQARLDKLAERGVIVGFGPDVSPAGLGFRVTAFVTLQIRQRYGHDPVATHLAEIPEVLEAHTITGAGDLLCRIVARSNADLQRVIDVIMAYEGIERASTMIALAEQVAYRTLPLVHAATAIDGGPPGGRAPHYRRVLDGHG
jgi:DNA-binding Lrp family transcriptional regulator